ncbi:helix-turn-helix transcriptional regulator [Ruegeria atlantica]|uniref:HTH-type quorum sensing-dependent transcriptional regulator VjbR n=2 Tax=Ruegeria TaxID=97050 RepID=A0A0P1EDZ5_9RHOB|nr:LuxR C-terminal-related transcriptional regulator [Ruegeria atlantica]CUH47654.1 HTH-type quorum sensing-dependent transcriptional regulator VjbR [Ruegeria atlantica]
MNALSLFTLDLLEELSLRHDDQERWEFTLDRLTEIGFNALNMLCFTPETGAIHWVRSSMSKGWLNRYDSQGYAEADPMLAQVQNGKESLYVQAASLRSADGHSSKALGLNHDLEKAGYIHLYSLVVPCPNNEAKLVVLSSDRPDAQAQMTERQRQMRVLATVLATNLGSDIPSNHGRVYDITSIAPTTPDLTPRELQVLDLLALGHRNDRIAELLNLSEVTVRTHLKNAREKLRAPTRESALVRAMQLGLINPPGYRNR